MTARPGRSLDDRCIIAWLDDGRPRSIAGAWADLLPGQRRRSPWWVPENPDESEPPEPAPVHVLERPRPAPADPGGLAALTSLWLHVAVAAGKVDSAPLRTWPAVVLDAAGTDGTPAVAVQGLDTATARSAGATLGLGAVHELTAEHRRRIRCRSGRPTTSRDRYAHDRIDVSWTDLDRWHTAHRRAATSAGLRPPEPARCGRCGSTHIASILYGMPVGEPPPWLAIGGCIITEGQPTDTCTACGWRP